MASRLLATAARRPALLTSRMTTRGMAVYKDFPKMTVSKNNWVEECETHRENKYASWELNGSNVVAVLFMTVIFPLGVYRLQKADLKNRDANQRGITKDRYL